MKSAHFTLVTFLPVCVGYSLGKNDNSQQWIIFKMKKMESCFHECKDNGTASTFHHRAPPSPPQANYSPAGHHWWMLSMPQIERILVIKSFRRSNCSSKLKSYYVIAVTRHVAAALTCRATVLRAATNRTDVYRADAHRKAISRANVQGDAVRSDTVHREHNTISMDRDGGNTTPGRWAPLCVHPSQHCRAR